MLRIGLTGELGTGKSTVAAMLAARGAVIFSSDEIARQLMQPGQPVFAAILEHFGPTVLTLDHTLDRKALAALAFNPAAPRIAELNALVHPAVLAEQATQLAALAQTQPNAIAVIESALILTTPYGAADRFDRLVIVTATDAQKIARFVERMAAGRTLTSAERLALAADARHRLSLQHATPPPHATLLRNDTDLPSLEAQVDNLWNSWTLDNRV